MTRRWLVAAVAAAVVAPAPAQALNPNYEFSKVADTNDPTFNFSNFGSIFAINSSGTVSFLGFVPAGTGIYSKTISGSVTAVADPSTPGFFCFCDGPTINAAGQVAFGAEKDASGQPQGVYVRAATGTGSITTVAETPTAMPADSTFGPPAINNNATQAQVAFEVDKSNGDQGVYVRAADGSGSVITVAETSSGGFTSFRDPVIGDSGKVAFFGQKDAVSGIYSWTEASGVVTPVATTGDGLSDFGDPAVNASGQVAYTAKDAGGDQRVYVGTTAVTTAGTYSSFGSVSINAPGQVAFKATLSNGKDGIYTGDNPASVTDYVIREDDPLDGKTVTDVDLSQFSLTDDGRIVFLVTFSDFSRGLFVATPVPEPGLVLGVAAVGLAAARRLRRR